MRTLRYSLGKVNRTVNALTLPACSDNLHTVKVNLCILMLKIRLTEIHASAIHYRLYPIVLSLTLSRIYFYIPKKNSRLSCRDRITTTCDLEGERSIARVYRVTTRPVLREANANAEEKHKMMASLKFLLAFLFLIRDTRVRVNRALFAIANFA